MITELGAHLADVMDDDLDQIHFTLQVTTDVGDILCAIEKYFGITANYAKGKGSMCFITWSDTIQILTYTP